MDYLDKNNIYKPETITLKFEDYQKLLDRIRDDEEFEGKLQEMVKERKLVYIRHASMNNIRGFVPLEKMVKKGDNWKIIE